jgi:hypothetical protein
VADSDGTAEAKASSNLKDVNNSDDLTKKKQKRKKKKKGRIRIFYRSDNLRLKVSPLAPNFSKRGSITSLFDAHSEKAVSWCLFWRLIFFA